MRQSRHSILGRAVLLATVLAAPGAAAFAQSPKAPARAPKSAKAVSQPSAAPAGVRAVITGRVVDVNANPVPNVPVRLRNLQVNAVEQSLNADKKGEFTFVAQPDIPYLVEVLDQNDRIISVGEVLIPHTGEVAATLLKIPARIPTVAGIFGETAGSIISTAAGMGITAIQSTVPDPPLSPER